MEIFLEEYIFGARFHEIFISDIKLFIVFMARISINHRQVEEIKGKRDVLNSVRKRVKLLDSYHKMPIHFPVSGPNSAFGRVNVSPPIYFHEDRIVKAARVVIPVNIGYPCKGVYHVGDFEVPKVEFNP